MLRKDGQVIPNGCLMMQHKPLVIDVEIKTSQRKKKTVGDFKFKWWNLTSENATKISERIKAKGDWELTTQWGDEMTECIRKPAKKIL